MKQTAVSTAPMNRRMVQQDLPFGEDFRPGWTGKRYLLCTDGVWHLILAIHPNLMADSQCCSDTTVVLPVPDSVADAPMCQECAKLHFPPAK